MICTQCKKNKVERFTKLQICNSCYVCNYRKNHPEKFNYKYGGMKAEAFKRDNYKCVLCGNNKNIAIHHLDNNGTSNKGTKLLAKEQNNRLNNLITLCTKCHNNIHTPVINSWTKKYNECIKCGTNKLKHGGNGLCVRCYLKKQNRKKKYHQTEKYKKYKQKWYKEKGKKLEKIRKLKLAT